MREIAIIVLLIVAARYAASVAQTLQAAIMQEETQRMEIERQGEIDAMAAIFGPHVNP